MQKWIYNIDYSQFFSIYVLAKSYISVNLFAAFQKYKTDVLQQNRERHFMEGPAGQIITRLW